MVCLNRPIASNFLKAGFHKFYMAHSWILCLIDSNDSNVEIDATVSFNEVSMVSYFWQNIFDQIFLKYGFTVNLVIAGQKILCSLVFMKKLWLQINADVGIFEKCVQHKAGFLLDWLSRSGLCFLERRFCYEISNDFMKVRLQVDKHLCPNVFPPKCLTWYEKLYSTAKMEKRNI